MATMAVMAGYHSPHLQSPAYLVSNTSPVSMMPLQRLAQSRSKRDFFNHLGWSERNEAHKRLYSLMKDEAAGARGSLSADRSNLTSEARADPRVQPPFSSSQMTETALHNEVLTIWRNAGPETRQIYDRGAYMDGQNVDNWIIRWVLWHVFRYRDSRNGPRSHGSRAGDAGARHQYDPVRDVMRSNH